MPIPELLTLLRHAQARARMRPVPLDILINFNPVMRLRKYLRLRAARGLSVATLGPNEARLIYDGASGIVALTAAAVFCLVFSPATLAADVRTLTLLALPVLLLGFNRLLGIYTSLRTATGTRKAAALVMAVACSSVAASLLSGTAAVPVLWALLVTGPLVLARVLLNLPYSRHKQLAQVAVNQRGPVLVIGGAGYIGSHTVELLLASGKRVRVLDRFMYGRESLADFVGHPRFEVIEGDATDITKLTFAMRGCSAVVHLAGLVGDPACAVDAEFTRQANIVATRMAKDVAQSLGVQRFIFSSSCSVYGVSDTEVDETADLNPVSLYAQTKIDSERELLYSARDEFFVTILRFATVFGDSRRPRFDLVGNLFTAQAITDGLITVIGPQQWRPFIHVRDLARAIVMVLEADRRLVQTQVFNVGDKRLNMTILQLAQEVQKVVAKYKQVDISVRENAEDRRNYAVCFDKIRNVLGFQAETLMDAGIEAMAAKLKCGDYRHYREAIYSNAAVTRQAAGQFHDPAELAHLYAPLNLP